MKTKEIAIIAGIAAGAILLTKGKIGQVVGESAGKTVTGAIIGLTTEAAKAAYEYGQSSSYIPIFDDTAYYAARSLDFLKNPIQNIKNYSAFDLRWDNARIN